MRTAEEILSSIFGYHFDNETNKEIAFGLHIKAINEARKEAIEECANRVHRNFSLTIVKQSILSLIKELK